MAIISPSRVLGPVAAPFPAGPLLVVSPHFDDLALSCLALLGRGAPATILQVFSGAPEPAVSAEWDTRSGFADSTAAIVARRLEEAAAFAGTGHDFRAVGLIDAQYVDLGPVGERAESDRLAVAAAITAWIDEQDSGPDAPPITVALPVGAGRSEGEFVPVARARALAARRFLPSSHVDHRGARDGGVLAARSRPQVQVVLYEELPYRQTRRGDRAARFIGACLAHPGQSGRSVQRFEVPVDRDEKARRLRAYATQLPLIFPPWAVLGNRLRWVLPRRERYWQVLRGGMGRPTP
jgi:LmbE family N-acetylglucosaminyl deacetylase